MCMMDLNDNRFQLESMYKLFHISFVKCRMLFILIFCILFPHYYFLSKSPASFHNSYFLYKEFNKSYIIIKYSSQVCLL